MNGIYNGTTTYPYQLNYNGPYQNPAPAALTVQHNGIVWVDREDQAASYLVDAGNSVLMMNKNKSEFYIKTVDIYGNVQPLRIYEFKEKTQPVNTVEPSKNDYVTKDELDKAISELKRYKKPDKYNKEKE